ncbi:MAG: polysaccharide deacetylase family protein [Rickettsiales bacterium]|jgi:peptidoglycan/xylan/chitin deacetylase (PgdA/CDA1 family)|nr:polysaccharide deacetylase family protein [Rickettsiales bacterium]
MNKQSVKNLFLTLTLIIAAAAAGRQTQSDTVAPVPNLTEQAPKTTPPEKSHRPAATTPAPATLPPMQKFGARPERPARPERLKSNVTDPGMVEHMDGITDCIPPDGDERVLYLTLDLCSGGFDAELIDWLAANKIPTTIFMTTRWIFPERATPARPAQFRKIAKNPIFQIENHGFEHLPASSFGGRAYGIAGTRNLQELQDEIMIAQGVIKNAIGGAVGPDFRDMEHDRIPGFYRSGTAMYDAAAVRYITEDLGLKIAGFKIAIDAGGTFTATQVYNEMMRSRPGYILLGHANRPGSGTNAGIRRAIPELIARGYVFHHLPR